MHDAMVGNCFAPVTQPLARFDGLYKAGHDYPIFPFLPSFRRLPSTRTHQSSSSL